VIRLFSEFPRPLIVAHRGACGLLPEQTIGAFELAIRQGADAIELDVVPTRDGVLVARHESELSLTTNVASERSLSQYKSRKVAGGVGGLAIEGWFTTDLMLEQIHRLGATQRMAFRDHSYDGRESVPTLDEVLELAESHGTVVFIEVKQPAYFASLGFPMDDLLLATLRRHDTCRVAIQSFESEFLKRLRHRTTLPIIQLFETTVFDLDDIAHYAQGIGPWKRLIVPAPSDVDGTAHEEHPRILPPTSLVADAHARNLAVCTWTFRNESQFLAPDYAGDPLREYQDFFTLRVDSVTTDFPATAVAARATPPKIANHHSQI
jgi:glycerophosphoryl diester phosphodiesterase